MWRRGDSPGQMRGKVKVHLSTRARFALHMEEGRNGMGTAVPGMNHPHTHCSPVQGIVSYSLTRN